MTRETLETRRKALEEAFFAKENERLLERLRQRVAEEDRRAELAAVLGLEHESLLDDLIAADVGVETIAALGLVPLVVVAWADGKVQSQERKALVEAAQQSGVKPGSIAWDLFSSWLDEEPDPRLFATWKNYVSQLHEVWAYDSIAVLEAEVTGRAERVARAAGGILGVGSIYGSESDVLKEIRDAFSRA